MKERTEKYWICDKCAKKKKWFLPFPNGITCISGFCGYCEREDETTLIPITDYSGPKKQAVWD